jgi:hypothetical protein
MYNMLFLVWVFLSEEEREKNSYPKGNKQKEGEKECNHFWALSLSPLFLVLPQLCQRDASVAHWHGGSQGCQICVGTWYQNRKKCTELAQNIPNGHKISKMSLKYSKWP